MLAKLKIIFSISLILSLNFIFVPTTMAASLTGISDTMSRLKVSTTSNHVIQFVTPTGIANGDTMTLTFEADFNIASVVTGDVTIEGVVVSTASPIGQTLTITAGVGNVVAASGTADIVIANNHITNPSTADSFTVVIGGTFGDTGNFAVAIAADDQGIINAVVDGMINLTITPTTTSLGAMRDNAVASATPFTITSGTNSPLGYVLTVKGNGNGSNPGLYKSLSPTKLIASSTATLSAGTEGYGIQASSASSGLVIDTVYDKSGNNVGGLSLSNQRLAYRTTSNSAADSIDVVPKAAVSFYTAAGNYQDILTFIATSNF